MGQGRKSQSFKKKGQKPPFFPVKTGEHKKIGQMP